MRRWLTLLSLLILAGCQSAPQPLTIDPPLSELSSSGDVNGIAVVDARAHSYLLRVERSQDTAQFSSSREPLEQTIKQALEAVIPISSQSPVTWKVIIDEALITVSQGPVKYRAHHEITLTVTASNGHQFFTRDFHGSAQSEGAFQADEAVLEREFSELLGSLLSDLANDPKLRMQQGND
ncbi:hypothetical protein CWI84_10610 [Idiomarina tyrosinivorans]|uniref:Lipoprotein n=1 Tax=Idiomarina tyrosinivorans TaxID=1445662 RepID=A0A432ZLB8_9GAMM|nr:YajG family lipoprotein [Idiomarina tyrosinivorans]RUO78781.1 hypothetical protein CWI84_10610 [Idiomarina tyrosinivorans]